MLPKNSTDQSTPNARTDLANKILSMTKEEFFEFIDLVEKEFGLPGCLGHQPCCRPSA